MGSIAGLKTAGSLRAQNTVLAPESSPGPGHSRSRTNLDPAHRSEYCGIVTDGDNPDVTRRPIPAQYT